MSHKVVLETIIYEGVTVMPPFEKNTNITHRSRIKLRASLTPNRLIRDCVCGRVDTLTYTRTEPNKHNP